MAKMLTIGTAILLATALTAAAAEQHLGELTVKQVWARATPGPTAAVYAELANRGKVADRLVKAETPIAERVEVHEHVMSGAIMSMQARPDLPLPAEAELRMAPGGVHMMLFGLARALKPGDRFPVTLEFERAGSLTVEALVGAAGAANAPP